MTSIIALSLEFRSFFFVISRESETILQLFLSCSFLFWIKIQKTVYRSSITNAGLLLDLTLEVNHDNYHSCRAVFKILITFQGDFSRSEISRSVVGFSRHPFFALWIRLILNSLNFRKQCSDWTLMYNSPFEGNHICQLFCPFCNRERAIVDYRNQASITAKHSLSV